MSCEVNEMILDQISMQVYGAKLSVDEMLDELGITFEDAYAEKLTDDKLEEMVIMKRFDESPQYEG